MAWVNFPESRADEQVATPTARRVLRQQVVEQPGSAAAAALGDAGQRGPFASEGHPEALRVVFAQREAAAVVVAAPVVSDTLDRAGHVLGPDIGVAGVLQPLGGDAQVQRRRVSDRQVGGCLLHPLDQLPLQFVRLGEPAVRRVSHTDVDERGHLGVVAGDPEPLQVKERSPHPLGAEPRRHHQHVRGDALVGVRVDERLGDVRQASAVTVIDGLVPEPLPDLLDRADAQRGREDLYVVLVAAQQLSLLEPGHRRAHSRVVGGRVPSEVLVLVLAMRISPGLATTSPPQRSRRFRLRSARNTPWISRRVSLERADMPNCRSTSAAS